MRFPKIETFNIDDLDLDESNPRFGVAPDQAGCINAIASSADSFKKLMRSVAIDDLGEPLLVLKRGKKRIIMAYPDDYIWGAGLDKEQVR